MSEIGTERLRLRPILLEDRNAIFEYRSDARTNQFQNWIPKDLNEVDKFIQGVGSEINEPGTWFQWVIIEKVSDQVIGDLGVHFIEPENQQCEMGCTLQKNSQSKGFATEALNAIIKYLFEDLKKHRISVSVDPENKKSIRLVERLGFRKEGHFKESLFINGKWVDDLVYALLRTEWNLKKGI